MEQQKAIIFDFFGVICSEIAPRWFREKLPREDPKYLHERFVKTVDLGKAPNDVMYETLGSLAQVSAKQVEDEWQSLVAIDQDLVSRIKELKQSYRIGLCSNAWSSFIRPILTDHNLMELFDVIVISSEVGVVKPDPEIFMITARKLNSETTNCIFIDDNPENVAAAASVGMKAIHYTTLTGLEKMLLEVLH